MIYCKLRNQVSSVKEMSTDRHHSLVDINPDPNLYQSTMNPSGCYLYFMESSDDDEQGFKYVICIDIVVLLVIA